MADAATKHVSLKLNMKISPTFFLEFKSQCARQGRTMSNVISELMRLWLYKVDPDYKHRVEANCNTNDAS